ncbi:PPE domain-containing protein [Saccharopolyspora rhizosphaerae]|uniref:PPE domain-containing protein n=1 Tax=Saccharopolyspora rhizosphaerae TaxID=2492662 RepID=A0A426JY86_9PSEU|nr:PPE domain-containing protein [Saccharopolyspora rhizosphaerae]
MTDQRHLEPASFEGAQLSQMRKWVESGAGAEAAYDASRAWNSEDQYLRDLKVRVEEKLKQVGAVMQSESGEAMQNQAMPVVLWTEVTADSAKLQSEQMTSQGEAFAKVQSSIPGKSEEQDVPDDSWIEEGWDSFWTGSTDAEDAKAHNEKLRQEAVQAFSTYQESSQNNVSGSAVFTPPPDGGMKTTVTGTPGPGVGGVGSSSPASTSSAWAGGSGGGGGSLAGSGAGAGGASGGGSAGTGAAWANLPGGGGPGSGQNPGGTGRVPGGPGTPGYPGGPGLGRTGAPGAGGMRPGAGSAGGRGGACAGRGLGAGSGTGAGGRAGAGMGAGGRAGMGGLGGASGAGVGGAGGAGGRGGAGAGAAGARGQGQNGEDDLEHETPDYLVGDQGVFDEDLPRVAPPVFGDWDNQR